MRAVWPSRRGAAQHVVVLSAEGMAPTWPARPAGALGCFNSVMRFQGSWGCVVSTKQLYESESFHGGMRVGWLPRQRRTQPATAHRVERFRMHPDRGRFKRPAAEAYTRQRSPVSAPSCWALDCKVHGWPPPGGGAVGVECVQPPTPRARVCFPSQPQLLFARLRFCVPCGVWQGLAGFPLTVSHSPAAGSLMLRHRRPPIQTVGCGSTTARCKAARAPVARLARRSSCRLRCAHALSTREARPSISVQHVHVPQPLVRAVSR
jgi:hypothetical protein